MKRPLWSRLSRCRKCGWAIVAACVWGCVAYVPPRRGVVYSPPVYAYQVQPQSVPPPVPAQPPAVAAPTAPGTASDPNPAMPPPTQPPQDAVIASQAPPPPQTEVVPVAPGPDYGWTPGYWSWNGGGWIWIGGRGLVRPRAGG